MSLSPMRFARPVAMVALAIAVSSCAPAGPHAPDSRRDDVVEILHGSEIADPYRWLEDSDSSETRAWIEDQQAFARQVLADAPPEAPLRARLEELYRADDASLPTVRGGSYFFARRPADRDVPLLYVRRSPNGDDEVLVDPYDIDANRSTAVDYAGVASDGLLAAFTVRRSADSDTEMRFIEVDTLTQRQDVLPPGRYSGVSIESDRTGVFYNRVTADGPRIFHHVFGTPTDADRVVFGRGYGNETIIESSLSSNGRYLLIRVSHGETGRDELHFRDTWAGTQVHPIVNDIDATFEGHIGGDTLFVLTDWEAPNRRVFAANLRRPSPDSWTEIIPEQTTPIESLATVGGRLLLHRLDNVRSRLTVHEPDGFPVRGAPLPENGALVGIGGGTWESDEVFYEVSSLAQPPTVYRYRVSDGNERVWAEAAASVEGSSVEVEQVVYTSADGTSVPMFVAHRSGLQIDGTHPAVLTGFGGFGVSVLAAFDPLAAAWMEQGGVWAIPSLRGGGELGAAWHRAGSRENKQNTFDDFIGAAEWLISHEYTSADRLAIRGQFNGGLLVGAALTQRPDLFAAVVCRDPVLDMLRYQLFPPDGRWVSEYGSATQADIFEYLADYSPYHRVAGGGRYPSVMLVVTGAESSPAPLHARKMTAALQAATTSSNPVVLLADNQAAGSGSRSADHTVAALVAELRFMLWRTR